MLRFTTPHLVIVSMYYPFWWIGWCQWHTTLRCLFSSSKIFLHSATYAFIPRECKGLNIVPRLTSPSPASSRSSVKDICCVPQLRLTVATRWSFSTSDNTWGRPLRSSESKHSVLINSRSGMYSSHSSALDTPSKVCTSSTAYKLLSCASIPAKNASYSVSLLSLSNCIINRFAAAFARACL